MGKKKSSYLEDMFEQQLLDMCYTGFVREYKFLKTRRFRFDFADPTKKIGIEIQGNIWKLGGHTSGTGIIRDCEKLALANIDGWTVFFISEPQVKDGTGIEWIKTFIETAE